MALAKVVYSITKDKDFAAQMRNDPEGALAKRGWKLSREEMAFLSRGLWGGQDRVGLQDLIDKKQNSMSWW